LFKMGGFPCQVKSQGHILLHFFRPFNYQLPIVEAPLISPLQINHNRLQYD
jgi:hypothetical protein